jgi:hypothetical protein
MALRACPRQRANCTSIARPGLWAAADRKALPMLSAVSCAYIVERVTRIELALSAWESVPSGLVVRPDLRSGLSASDRERPLVTGVNGPLMAR